MSSMFFCINDIRSNHGLARLDQLRMQVNNVVRSLHSFLSYTVTARQPVHPSIRAIRGFYLRITTATNLNLH